MVYTTYTSRRWPSTVFEYFHRPSWLETLFRAYLSVRWPYTKTDSCGGTAESSRLRCGFSSVSILRHSRSPSNVGTAYKYDCRTFFFLFFTVHTFDVSSQTAIEQLTVGIAQNRDLSFYVFIHGEYFESDGSHNNTSSSI